MTQPSGDSRSRLVAIVIAAIGLALSAHVELGLMSSAAQDRFGWFVYEAAAWLAGYLTYLHTQRERAHG